MLLADANGGGPLPTLVESTPEPTVTPTATPSGSVQPLPSISTSTGAADPIGTVIGGDSEPNFSWVLWLILIVAVIGGIVTLYLRNRKK